MKRFLGALSLLLSLSFPFAGTVLAQGDHYRFVMVSHIGSEANMNWSTTSMKTFDEKYPGVKTEYLSTNDYNLQSFIAILNQAIRESSCGCGRFGGCSFAAGGRGRARHLSLE